MGHHTPNRISADVPDLPVPNHIYHNGIAVPLPVSLLQSSDRTFLYSPFHRNRSIRHCLPALVNHIPLEIMLSFPFILDERPVIRFCPFVTSTSFPSASHQRITIEKYLSINLIRKCAAQCSHTSFNQSHKQISFLLFVFTFYQKSAYHFLQKKYMRTIGISDDFSNFPMIRIQYIDI